MAKGKFDFEKTIVADPTSDRFRRLTSPLLSNVTIFVRLTNANDGKPPCKTRALTPGTVLEDSELEQLVRDHFDLTPRGIIESLDLRRPIYKKTAAYGHFGREEASFSWERLDKVGALRKAAGLTESREMDHQLEQLMD